MKNLSDDEDFMELVGVVVEGVRRNPRVFRDRPDHFQKWSDEEFFNRFRLTKNSVLEVLSQLNIGPNTMRNCALSASDMLLLTLRFFATGSMLIVAGDFMGVHKSTASRVIDKVSRHIALLARTHIKFPQTLEDTSRVNLGFYKIAKFPRCVGAIDCTHIKIQSPGGNEAEIYRNRKGYFSFNVQCICDASLCITSIVSRWCGSSHDSLIFNSSRIRGKFENGDFGDNLLIGDSGYGVKPYLITPLANPSTPAEHLFNEAQIRTRNPIERCFGVWKRRFPILAVGIRLNIEKIEAIIVATAVLHNIACKNNESLPATDDNIEHILQQEMANVDINPVHPLLQGDNNNIVRQNLIANHFSTLL